MKDASKKKLEVMPAAPEEVVNKDGKVFVKTPEGKLVVQEDRASGQVTVSFWFLCQHALAVGHECCQPI